MHRSTPSRPARGGSGGRSATLSPTNRRAVSPLGGSISPRPGGGDVGGGQSVRRGGNFGSNGDGGGWVGVLGIWRICLSAPRRATLFAAILAVGLIGVTVARASRSPATPDTGKLASVLSSSSYVHEGKVVVDKAALLSAFGVHKDSHAEHGGNDKIALYDTAQGLKLAVQPVESKCQDRDHATKALVTSLANAGFRAAIADHRVAASCTCGIGAESSALHRQPWEATSAAPGAGAIGVNAANPNNLTLSDVQYQAYAADLLQFALLEGDASQPPSGDLVLAGISGLQHGIVLAGPGWFPMTIVPERGASFFAEGLGRACLLLANAGRNAELAQIARPDILKPIAKWLGTSGSMKGQGGHPEVRFARAAALHMLAPFLDKADGQQAALSAHRYARRGVELQTDTGEYCHTPHAKDPGDEPECVFSEPHHARALLYAARLHSVCGWAELRSVLRASIDMGLTRLVASLPEPPPQHSVSLPSERGEHLRAMGEAILVAASELNRPNDVVLGRRLLAALVWGSTA